jgi:hypothetical protein
MTNTIPNFFILGAAKAGTTTLVDILRQHPQAYLPFDKEPMFFSRDVFYQNGLEWYSRTYFKNAHAYPVRGEASPHYLYWAEKVAPRVKTAYDDHSVRFIVILRHPVDRAYSWYWNMVREGLEDLPFEQALAEEPGRLRINMDAFRSLGSMQYGYVFGSRYAAQLNHFLDCFERSRFLFLLQDDLLEDFNRVSRQVFQFLDLEEHVQVRASISNPASMPRSRWFQRLLQGKSSMKVLIKRLMPRQMRYQAKRALLNANAVKVDYPPMQEDTRMMLQNQFLDDNRRLSKIINRDLSNWEQQ